MSCFITESVESSKIRPTCTLNIAYCTPLNIAINDCTLAICNSWALQHWLIKCLYSIRETLSLLVQSGLHPRETINRYDVSARNGILSKCCEGTAQGNNQKKTKPKQAKKKKQIWVFWGFFLYLASFSFCYLTLFLSNMDLMKNRRRREGTNEREEKYGFDGTQETGSQKNQPETEK